MGAARRHNVHPGVSDAPVGETIVECDEMHRQFGALANGDVQIGELPAWTRIHGRVAWYVYSGPYSELGEKGWRAFWTKFTTAPATMGGVPGDLYVCSPDAHVEEGQKDMLTLLFAPVA